MSLEPLDSAPPDLDLQPSPDVKVPKLRILGSLSLISNSGQPCTPRALKLRILLANLLCNHNRTVSVEHLIHELWCEAPPKSAKTALQVYVSSIRKIFDSAYLEPSRMRVATQPPGYMLVVEEDELDLAIFERNCREAQDAQACNRKEVASALLSTTLNLWRGSALSDVCTTPGLQAEARRMNEMRQAVQERKVLLDLELGRHAEVISELYALASRHPYHENLCAYLMIALHRQGRPADALDVYRDLTRALRTELGLDPSDRLQQLHQSILLREPIAMGAHFQIA